MNYSLSQFRKSKEGNITILFVIIALIGLFVIAGFTNLLQKRYLFEETQSIMDIAGTSALQAGVDETALKHGEFEIDEVFVSEKYKELVSESLLEYAGVAGYHFKRIQVWDDGPSDFGTGASHSTHPQAFIDSTMIIVVGDNSYLAKEKSDSKLFYNAREGNSFSVSYHGTTPDGKTELMVRSVSRIVLR